MHALLMLVALELGAPCQLQAVASHLRSGTATPAQRAEYAKQRAAARGRAAACWDVVLAQDSLQNEGPSPSAQGKLQRAQRALPQIRHHLDLLGLQEQPCTQRAAAQRLIQRLTKLAKAEPTLKPEINRTKRKCTIELGDPKWTLKALAKDESPLALYARAKAKETLGQKAAPLWKRLLVLAPASPQAIEIEKRLERSKTSTAARLTRPLSLGPLQQAKRIEALIGVARRQRAAFEGQLAISRLPALKGAPSPGVIELQRAYVRALVRSGKPAQGLAHSKGLLELAAKAGAVPDRWLEVHAWALGKAQQHLGSSKAWAELAATTQDEALASESCFMSGFLAYEADAFQVARQRWSACAITDAGRRIDALWYRAMMALLEKKPKDAITALREVSQLKTDGRRKRRHEYWLGKLLLQAGAKSEGKKLLRRLSARAPVTWYGLLARKRLGLPKLKGSIVPPLALANKASMKRYRKAQLLLGLGMGAWGQRLVKGSSARALAASQKLGNWFHAMRKSYRVRPKPPTSRGRLTARAGWRASYPEPWPQLVSAAAKRHGVEPTLIYAIMRTESRFEPTVQSRVGATGLLQLMPYSARGISKVLKKKAPAREQLKTPEVAIDLGAAILGLNRKELGSKLLATAAYNGAVDNVVRWQTRYGHLDAELFVERIPFKETRRYVKKVLAVEALYRGLRGKPVSLDLKEGPIGAPPERFTKL